MSDFSIEHTNVHPVASIFDHEEEKNKNRFSQANDNQEDRDETDEKISQLISPESIAATAEQLSKLLSAKGIKLNLEELHEIAKNISKKNLQAFVKQILKK